MNRLIEDKAFFYFNSYKLFKKARKIFDYTFEFKKQDVIDGKPGKIDPGLFSRIRFIERFDIFQFVLNNFSGENLQLVPLFHDQLLAHYVMKDETPLTETDVNRIYKNLVPRKDLSLLFGKKAVA